MCQYCGYYPQYQYSPYSPYSPYSQYQYSGASYAYPQCGYNSPYYGYPVGYAYTLPSPPVIFTIAPQYPRGEYRVGNCLMIC